MNDTIDWVVSDFQDLSASQLYEILHLRSKVFVVEQSDIYLDPDCKDQKAVHILGYANGNVVAYCRVFKSGDYIEDAGCIGRVLVTQKYRSSGLGRDLVTKAIEVLSKERKIQIAAQLYLHNFYRNFGFVVVGNAYLEGSIEHIDMVKMT